MAGPVHPFDEAIALGPHPGSDSLFTGHTSGAYANMVGPFGGIVAAQMLKAVMLHPKRLGEPVALTVNYAAGLADGPFQVLATPARTNRSTQHWVLEVEQNGEVALTGTVMTAVRRDTWADTELPMPQVPVADAVPQRGALPPMAWVQRYDMRFVEGGLPAQWNGQDTGHSRSLQWLRDEPPRPLDFCSLAALCDAFFIRLYQRRATRVPVGTVSMTVYFHADSDQLTSIGAAHVLGQAVGQNFRKGYFDQAGQIWSAAGDLLATTNQLVYYRE
jgi:acyl-CoA thioesterase